MKTFEDLIEIIEDSGFDLAFNYSPGSYRVIGYSYTVGAYLDESLIEISMFSDHQYKIDFFFRSEDEIIVRSSKTKFIEKCELEKFLLISIVRGSFFTEEEEKVLKQNLKNLII